MPGSPRTSLDDRDRTLLDECRVGRLATASAAGRPHVIPLCYAVLDATTLVFAIDDKPKPVGRPLRRMENLAQNERFALVVDRWDEDWGRLAYVLVEGSGVVLDDPGRCAAAIEALRGRYPQYEQMDLAPARHAVVELKIDSVRRWHGS